MNAVTVSLLGIWSGVAVWKFPDLSADILHSSWWEDSSVGISLSSSVLLSLVTPSSVWSSNMGGLRAGSCWSVVPEDVSWAAG